MKITIMKLYLHSASSNSIQASSSHLNNIVEIYGSVFAQQSSIT